MITLNGREFQTREYWVCACSGGHFEIGEDGSNDPKCWRKGGEWQTAIVDPETGKDIAVEMDPRDGADLVRDYGWRALGGDIFLMPGVDL